MFKGKFQFNTEFLSNLVKPKTPPLIGVDISSSSVKMVELSSTGKGTYKLERYTIEPLPHEAVVDGNIMNLEHSATTSTLCFSKRQAHICSGNR